ncbi:class I SAM-dependent methyltransferase [Blastococcus saxobsidens]|uniref:Methyltransferase family protein n=1 Tax=Blastococcus saxobsidens TaxID=138336 RepID=A0A4Q7Y9P0_9ACTN|nr:class I SAM-dependent methyltransferase [Blastococcus saxobsidens]RZU33528.1 methyltransferase family protein [Blastococcus saxobsidens]
MTPTARCEGPASWPADAAAAESWAARWDAIMKCYQPAREPMLATTLDALEHLGLTGSVLDLGCGVGSIADRVLDRWPQARVTALDWDPVMLAICRARLGDRVAVVEADLAAPGWSAAVPGPVDAVITCAVLHMLDADRHAELLGDVAGLLRPGGVHVDVDEMPLLPSSPRLAATGSELSAAGVRARFAEGREDVPDWYSAVTADPATAPLLDLRARRFDGRQDGRSAGAGERIVALRAAGFFEAGVLARALDQAVVVALRCPGRQVGTTRSQVVRHVRAEIPAGVARAR